jgi:hypothetical protein
MYVVGQQMTRREPYAARLGDYCNEEEFTKWFAGNQDLDNLSSHQPYHDHFERTIGMELWNLQSEVQYDGEYGGYRADIVARGYDGDQFADVVIEAQFDRSKESALNHLGKLIHYGNLADADVLVWLTDAELDSRIYETVAWLAPQTTGLALQVVETKVKSNTERIDTFEFERVVPKTAARPGNESGVKQHQRRYWAQFADEWTDDLDSNVPPSAGPVYKQGRAIQIGGVRPELVVDSTDNKSKVRIHFRQSAPSTLYQRLANEREEIQNSVNSPGTWTWNIADDRPSYKILIERNGLDLQTTNEWETHQRWQQTVLTQLRDEVIERHTE